MSPHDPFVVRRADSHPTSPSTRGERRLPDDLIADFVRRLELFAAIGVGLWIYAIVYDLFLVPRAFSTTLHAAPGAGVPIGVAGALTSAAMFAYVRYAPHHAKTKGNVGLGFLLLNAFGVALLNGWVGSPVHLQPMLFLSWNTVVILVFAMIATASPRQLLIAAVAAASMDPLVVWFAHLRGEPVPSVMQTALLFLPNYVCAVVALLPSLTLHRLSAKLKHAQELGSYRLVERLGHGGMGEVWRAEHRLLARSAAVKLVRPEVLGSSNAAETMQVLRRFEREARATASLHSPHTIQIYDFGTTEDGNFYYVMELLAGRDLESLVREFGPVPASRAIFLLRQVCHSLADAHARGLVHRDIKPANVYACRMGLEYDFVKVLDFGLVKTIDRDRRRETIAAGELHTSGTPAYMAPEVILGDADVDRRADVYAVGCVAYYLLTGQLVFDGDTPMKLLMQHVNDRPVPPSERSELKIPRELDALVLSCLEKDPNRRPQHAEELFQRAIGCTACEGWSQDDARGWWQAHMPELCGPLTLESTAAPASRARAAALMM